MKRFQLTIAAALAMGLLAAGTAVAGEAGKAPMPQTRGMQNMDPALHDKWAKEGPQDPYKDCVPNAAKAAQQAKHPMPETKGMKGMDPKAHTVDCPAAPVQSAKRRYGPRS